MSTNAPLPGGPRRLTLVTDPDDCNLACAMCPCGAARARGDPEERRVRPRRMERELALAVLDERRGSPLREVIPSTMGEPLLWSGLDALVAKAAEHGLALNVTTNGTWPGRGAARWAEALLPVARDVKLSWNGSTAGTAEAIMPGLSFERAVEDAAVVLAVRDRLAAAGGRRATISFQVTAQEANVAELAEIVALAARLGVDRVKLNHLQVRFPALAAGSLRRSAEAIGRWNAAVASAREVVDAARAAGRPAPVLENAVPLALDPRAPAPRGPCPFVGKEAWVHFDGRLAPCPHPAAATGELVDLGSVAEAPLGALWAGERLRAFVEHHLEHPVCRTCAFRTPGGA